MLIKVFVVKIKIWMKLNSYYYFEKIKPFNIIKSHIIRWRIIKQRISAKWKKQWNK